MTPSELNFKRVRPALGTLVAITLGGVSSDQAEQLFSSAFAELMKLEKIFNFFDETSELSLLNQKSYIAVAISSELADVLRVGAKIEKVSGGGFRLMPECSHPTGKCYAWVGDDHIVKSSCRFDLGGIAKGAIVDRVFDHLTSLVKPLVPDAKIAVNAGGDLRCSEIQSIEIRIPGSEGEQRFGVEIPHGAIATSSVDSTDLDVGTGSARYGEANRSRANYRSASVVARTCVVADAWTKVALFSSEPTDGLKEFGEEFGVLAEYRFNNEGMLSV
jgi:thiamine biosynthesis lipoprotein ApbE